MFLILVISCCGQRVHIRQYQWSKSSYGVFCLMFLLVWLVFMFLLCELVKNEHSALTGKAPCSYHSFPVDSSCCQVLLLSLVSSCWVYFWQRLLKSAIVTYVLESFPLSYGLLSLISAGLLALLCNFGLVPTLHIFLLLLSINLFLPLDLKWVSFCQKSIPLKIETKEVYKYVKETWINRTFALRENYIKFISFVEYSSRIIQSKTNWQSAKNIKCAYLNHT